MGCPTYISPLVYVNLKLGLCSSHDCLLIMSFIEKQLNGCSDECVAMISFTVARFKRDAMLREPSPNTTGDYLNKKIDPFELVLIE